MTWFKVDSTWAQHPKMVTLSDAAVACWFRMLGYCSTYLTDGALSSPVVGMFDPTGVALSELESAGLVERDGSMVLVVGYLDHQRSKAQVEREREKARRRKEKSRARHGVTDGVTGGVTDGVSHGRVTQPDTDTDTDTEPTYAVEGLRESSTERRGVVDKVESAVVMWADRELAAAVDRGGVRSPDALRAKILKDADRDRAARVAADYPSITASQLAGVLSGNASILSALAS